MVRKAQNKITGVQRAVKIINKVSLNEEEKQKLRNEVNILRNLDHPNILKVYEFYGDQ